MFKVGDMVRCIDIPTSDNLTETIIYTVEKCGHHYGPDQPETIKIEGKYWFAYRFELVKENNMDHYEIEVNIDASFTVDNWVPVTSLGKTLQFGDLQSAEKRLGSFCEGISPMSRLLRIVKVETITNTVRTVV